MVPTFPVSPASTPRGELASRLRDALTDQGVNAKVTRSGKIHATTPVAADVIRQCVHPALLAAEWVRDASDDIVRPQRIGTLMGSYAELLTSASGLAVRWVEDHTNLEFGIEWGGGPSPDQMFEILVGTDPQLQAACAEGQRAVASFFPGWLTRLNDPLDCAVTVIRLMPHLGPTEPQTLHRVLYDAMTVAAPATTVEDTQARMLMARSGIDPAPRKWVDSVWAPLIDTWRTIGGADALAATVRVAAR